MATVSSSVTVQLKKEDKEILEAAIKLIKDISDEVCCSCSNMYCDSESVFYCLKETYQSHDGHLPTIVDIYE